MNNYQTHLDWEYRSLMEQDKIQMQNFERQQAKLKSAAKILADTEEACAIAKEYYERTREDVRDAHAKRMLVRKRLGEIEGEYFASAEAHEDWHQ